MPNVMRPGGPARLKAAALEFAGVLVEDGLRETLRQLAERNRQHADVLYKLAQQMLEETGYLVGGCTHVEFWQALQRVLPLRGRPSEFSDMVVLNYALRPRVVASVRIWRNAGLRAVLLCDNTDWLDRFEARHKIFQEFDGVFNSFHMHKTKRDPAVYEEVAAKLQLQPSEILAIDASADALGVARKVGYQTLLFGNPDRFMTAFEEVLGRNAGKAGV